VRSCKELPLCPTEPMPSGSKTDPLLAKSESISNGGSTSVITYLQREKKKPGAKAIAAREGSETM